MNKYKLFKLVIILLIVVFNAFTVQAQFHNFRKVEKVKELQNKTLLIALSNDPEVNEVLEKVLNGRWTFSPFKVIPDSLLPRYKKSKEHSCLTTITKSYSYSSISFYAVLNSCKMPKKGIILDVVLASLEDYDIRHENKLADFIMQVIMMNSVANYSVKLTDDDDLGYKKQARSCAAASIDDLTEKTLLVREANMKITLDEVKSVYNGKIKVATDKEVVDALLQSQEDKAILVFESDPQSNKSYFVILNPATGHIYHYYRIQKLNCDGKMDLKEFTQILKPKKKKK